MSSYDQALLDEAPKASRAQLQQGYDVDLLEPRRTPSVRHPHSQTPQPTPVPLMPGFAETGPVEKITSLSHTPAAPRTKPSFWRSRNGIITLFVIAVVVVGAVVGGAVGGTVNKHNNSKTETSGPTSSSSSASSSLSSFVPTSSSSASDRSAGVGGQPTPTAVTAPSLPSSSLSSGDNSAI